MTDCVDDVDPAGDLAGDHAGHEESYLAGLNKVSEGLEVMIAAGFSARDAEEARVLLAAVEGQVRRVEAVRVDAVDKVASGGWHRRDGHRNAKVMCRHVGRLSEATALRLDRAARALRDLPAWKTAFQAGLVSGDQVAVMARAWANPRVRHQLIGAEGFFLEQATDPRRDYWYFERLVAGWVDRVDEDGAGDRHRRSHTNRDAKLIQDYDGSWKLSGGGAANDGAELSTILDRFVDEQFQADWNEARDRHGDIDGLAQHLARTPQQRRWDALMELARRAASTLPGTSGSQVVTNIVIDHHTFERYAAAHAGAPRAPDEPTRPGRCCRTLDGRPIDPAAATAAALVGHIRRVVIDAAGVVIDLSRRTRLFRDHAALAARLNATTCYWPGCWTPVNACEIDHLLPWSNNGPTDQRNAAPGCGAHNRLRNSGYRAERNPDGTITVQHPDGTPIE